jgi:hypothetical protein
MTDLLRATTPPEHLAEFDQLEERYKALARQLPWTDDAFNEMMAINRRLLDLAIAEPRESAA